MGKRFKFMAKRKWWRRPDGVVHYFRHLSGDRNMLETVDGQGYTVGPFIFGVTIHDGWQPISKWEWDQAKRIGVVVLDPA